MSNINYAIKKYEQRKNTIYLASVVCIFILLIFSIFALCYGKNIYSLNTVLDVLLNKNIKGATYAIKNIRLPRLIISILVGLSFGVAGNSFQTVLNNPLASPDVIGVSSSCSVVAVLFILLFNVTSNLVSVYSIIFGVLISVLIYVLASKGGFDSNKLILIGIGMQSLMNAIISYLLQKSSQYQIAVAIRWISGSLNSSSMSDVSFLIISFVIFYSISLFLNKYLVMLQLKDEIAISLGVSVNVVRILSIFTSIVLVACSVSVVGPISSVAFLSVPISRKLVKNSQSSTLLASLIGALIVCFSDVVAQYLFSVRYPVGVITGIIGAPYLLYLLINVSLKENLSE